MNRLFVGVVMLSTVFVAGTAVGQTDDKKLEHLRKPNPNDLVVIYYQNPVCSISEEEAELTIDGVLTRSRIKPIWSLYPLNLHLVVWADCLDDDTAFVISVRFGEYASVKKPHGTERFKMYHLDDYGSFGRHQGDSKYMMRYVKSSVENAITNYLKANFDL